MLGRRLAKIGLLTTGALAASIVAGCASGAATTPNSATAASHSTSDTVQASATGRPVTSPASGGAVPSCHTSDLAVTLDQLGSQSQKQSEDWQASLVFTNKSGHSCFMDGFPGVDLVGQPDGSLPGTYSLPRERQYAGPSGDPTIPDVHASSVVLAPGGTAHADLGLMVAAPGDIGSENTGPWTPSHLEVTPPNETTQFTVAWPQNIQLIRMDTATENPYQVSPVLPGAR